MDTLLFSTAISISLQFLVAIFVLLNDPRKRINRIYSGFLFSLALWTFSDGFHFTPIRDFLTPIFWMKMGYIGAVMTPPFFAHFAFEFSQIKAPKYFIPLFYLSGVIVAILSATTPLLFQKVTLISSIPPSIDIIVGPLMTFFSAEVFITLILNYVLVFKSYRKASGILKQQFKYFFLATFSIVIAGLFYFAAIFGGLQIRLDNFFTLMYTSIIAYSITKHRLMDISVVITKSAALLLSLTIYGISYLCVLFLIESLGISWTNSLLIISSILFFGLVGFTFEKLRIHLQTTAEKLFLKGHYDSRKVLSQLSQSLVHSTSLETLSQHIEKIIGEDLEIHPYFLAVPQKFESQKDLTKEFEFVTQRKMAVTLPGYAVLETETKKAELRSLADIPDTTSLINEGFTHLIPLFDISKNLIGVLGIGKKLSEDAYTPEDEETLLAIASMSSSNLMRIKQARVSAEIQIAQSIQSELVPTPPEINGLEIECYMKAADEVGGDYYDIFKTERGTWFILGDVTGHGISAGLTMFMVQSIVASLIKTLSEITPAKLNFLANQILYQNSRRLSDPRPMSIVTLFTEDGRHFKVSGSHDNIYIFHHDIGKVEPINVENFPFGIGLTDTLEESLFGEIEFTLKEGDFVFLATDGIHEAYENGIENSTQYSENRLIEFLEAKGKTRLSGLKKDLINHINTFTKGIFFDDVTFMVIKAAKK